MLLNTSSPSISLRPAVPSDWPAVEALLLANKLPLDGACEHFSAYLLAISNGEVVGSAGVEAYGTLALMRSVAVAPGLQKQGIGRMLVERLIGEAQLRGASALYLLTVTAPEYFAQFGFKRAKVGEAPAALQASAELQGACPAFAAFMELPLREAVQAEGDLPVAVLGAGPVGLAAVAKLIERGIPFVVLEARERVGANLIDYGHVRLFSPWKYNIDASMAKLLTPTGWSPPAEGELPLARAIVEQVLQPFAALPQVSTGIQLEARVISVSREGFDKVKSAGRDKAPFLIRFVRQGQTTELRARALIDATGTWGTPNPVGASGLTAIGEREAANRIFYGIPDVMGKERNRYEGKRTLVVGAGHSAANALLALSELAKIVPGTRLAWSVRSPATQRLYGGGDADALPARGQLGASLRRLRESGALEFFSGLRVTEIRQESGALTVVGLDAKQQQVTVKGIDQIVCATGQRPDLSLTSELRVRLDPWLESTEALGPLIDPNVHSCGTVRPHGHRELAHPELGLYTVGVKSYGRAPTFLMATGFEQVRSVVAAIAGDLAAADRVELDLPETGVCSSSGPSSTSGNSGCRGAEPVSVDTNAASSAVSAGGGCGTSSCGTKPEAPTPAAAPRCCG